MKFPVGLTVSAVVILAGVVVGLNLNQANARPNYHKAWQKAYPKFAETDLAKETKCNLCHFGKSKKNRNDYGKAVGKALGEPKIKDEGKVLEALKKAEAGKNGEGKSFGDLLKANSLPAKNPE